MRRLERFKMSKLPIRRLNSPHDDSNSVNLETIVMGDTTQKVLYVSWGSTIHQDISCRPINTRPLVTVEVLEGRLVIILE